MKAEAAHVTVELSCSRALPALCWMLSPRPFQQTSHAQPAGVHTPLHHFIDFHANVGAEKLASLFHAQATYPTASGLKPQCSLPDEAGP